jgi:hypothetical protein
MNDTARRTYYIAGSGIVSLVTGYGDFVILTYNLIYPSSFDCLLAIRKASYLALHQKANMSYYKAIYALCQRKR